MQQATNISGDGNTTATSPAATGATGTATTRSSHVNGGRFDFDDGGTYCGGWEEGKAHGHGICTGPKGQGAYSGSWHYGFEVSGVYTWPSGSCFEGQWQNGKRHGLGVETRGRWIYRGEWTQGFKGRYGVRQSNTSTAKYEGTWANGLQDGYGSETYADDGTYQGQWLRGMRHGYGVRTSAPFGKASKYRTNKTLRASLTSLRSNEGGGGGGGGGGVGGGGVNHHSNLNTNNADLTDKRDRRVDDSRGGFVLKMNSSEPTARRRSLGSGNIKKGLLMGLKLKKQRSTGDLEKRGGTGGSGSIRSTGSTASWVSTDSAQSGMTNTSIPSDSNASFVVEDDQMDPNVTETYMGEWKNDKRCGFGISERSDGLKYEGEWYNNKKYGYGVTTFINGEKEEGKYKNNILITSQTKKKLFLMRSVKFRERIDAAVNAAQRASKIAIQKADIAITRSATARSKAEQADLCAMQAREDSNVATEVAKRYAPDFKQPGLERLKQRQRYYQEQFQHQQQQYQQQQQQQNLEINQKDATVGNQIPNQVPVNKPPPMAAVSATNTTTANYNQNFYGNQPNHLSGTNQNHTNNINNNNVNSSQLENNTDSGNNNNKMNNEIMPGNNKPRNSLTNNDDLNAVRRTSRRVSGDRPYLANLGQQSSIDHFDHYKRPPSRDSSVDRYTRATGRLLNSSGGGTVNNPYINSGTNSRQPSVERSSGLPNNIGGVGVRQPSETPDRTLRAPSTARGTTPVPTLNQTTNTKNGSIISGNNPGSTTTTTITQQAPFEEIILRKRGLGQDIVPSPNQPKRTESLYTPGVPAPQIQKNLVTQQQQTTLQRKKSLPDFQELPRSIGAMSREEVSYLGSARREELRRQADERERLRANPLLYLVSPQVKDWFSRQQLVIIVLFINISLAIMFFKLLT